MLAEILTDWEKAKGTNIKRIMAEKQKFVYGLFIITIFIYVLGGCSYIIYAIVTNSSAKSIEERQHFVHAKYPFRSKVSPIFEIISCVQIISLIPLFVGIALINSLYVMMVITYNNNKTTLVHR